MSQGQMNTFDATTTGLKFTRPAVTLTSANMGINGGLSFDLPLASLTMSQNRALDFISANAAGIKQAMTERAVLGGNSIDMTITGSGAATTALSAASINSLFNLNAYAINSAENIYGMGVQQQRYVARKNSKLCFITTAVCESQGKADDCEELQILRAWRDNVLRMMPGGEAMISVYYRVAPMALQAIKAREDAAQILEEMRGYIARALDAIAHGENVHAFGIYCSLLEFALEAGAIGNDGH